MLNNEVREFLRKPRVARLATIGSDGYPHIVPIYFMLDGDDILFGSDRDNRKVRNALTNPKGAVVVGGEPATDEAGYTIQGNLTMEDDTDHSMARRMLCRYESKDEAEKTLAAWVNSDLVIIRLKPKSIIRVW
ncbi:MAG: pyridoxamine 5'-phosphate oxidase family protein [Candidatus Bathyarchaeota archaeon]|nr:pyridoxamine 5'-phosphate oxidase family protein [Candidatus Bathyarchaeota archaeon]MDH5745770.1 pyridoxamine 5'-phosphate oxidase family protein [Candidatus Bathyarchaeota archaeon]